MWNPFEQGWLKSFDKLKKFRHENPGEWPFMGEKLGIWCINQRIAKAKNKLSDLRIKRLEEIGFIWDKNEKEWYNSFDKLKIFYSKNENEDPSLSSENPEEKSLNLWCATQRLTKRNSKLSDLRIKRLEEIGFIWDKNEKIWQQNFDKLKTYRKENPKKWPSSKSINKEEKSLGMWCGSQKKTKKNSKLSQLRISLLEEIGFFEE